MVIRGAPAIGVAAAMGIALGMLSVASNVDQEFQRICDRIQRTRPTAVNLFWAIERMKRKFAEIRTQPLNEIQQALIAEAQKIHTEDIAANRRIGNFGNDLVPENAHVLTHCNAGALA